MKYLTLTELQELASLVQFLSERMGHELSFDVTVLDTNGEVAGRVCYTEGGDYGFIPDQDDNA
jgi:hypothetical protein